MTYFLAKQTDYNTFLGQCDPGILHEEKSVFLKFVRLLSFFRLSKIKVTYLQVFKCLLGFQSFHVYYYNTNSFECYFGISLNFLLHACTHKPLGEYMTMCKENSDELDIHSMSGETIL